MQNTSPQVQNQESNSKSISNENSISIEPLEFDSKDIRILFVGPDDCGKSTLCRHFELINYHALPEPEKEDIEINIQINLISDIKVLADFIQLSGQHIDEKILPSIQKISSLGYDVDEISPEIANEISIIWQDPSVKEYYKQNNSIGWNENTSYFFENATRISQKGYTPTNEDILKSRTTTSETSTLKFQVDKRLKTEIIDVCGKKTERSKLNRWFNDVDYIFYIASLSDFDQYMLEDENVKRTQDSIELFRMISNVPSIKQTPIFLTLNKKDVFEKKLKEKPELFKESYPGFEGDINNLDECIEHVKKYFVKQLPQERINNKEGQPFETFVTCAIDQKSSSEFFQAIFSKIVSAHPNK